MSLPNRCLCSSAGNHLPKPRSLAAARIDTAYLIRSSVKVTTQA